MKKKQFKATTLRTILILLLVLCITSSVVGFYYAQDYLKEYATSSLITAPVTDNAQSISQLKTTISNNKLVADKSKSITVPTVEYSDQATKDIRKYATDTNITISNIEAIKEADSNSVSPMQQINPTKTQLVAVSIDKPVKYTDLINFLKLTETNLPKMQIASININRVNNSSGDVTVDSLTIKVYVK